jgi:hypothetical protein
MPDFIRTVLAKLADFVATRRRLSQFTCGDCERWHRCGLAPDARCTARVVQVARGDWRWRRRARAVASEWAGW